MNRVVPIAVHEAVLSENASLKAELHRLTNQRTQVKARETLCNRHGRHSDDFDRPASYGNAMTLIFERLAERDCLVIGNGSRYMAQCPAHEDRSPSLSLTEKANGAPLLHCFAGCDNLAVLNALGLRWGDLGPFA